MEELKSKLDSRINELYKRAHDLEQEAKICSAIADELVDLMVSLDGDSKETLSIPTPVSE